MKKNILISLGLSVVLLNGIISTKIDATETESTPINYIQPARHISKTAGYSIQFPPTWEVVSGAMGADVIALAPAADPEDLFKKNANVIYAKLDKNITRDSYYDLNLKSLNQLLEDFDLENSRDVTIGGVQARELVFSHTMGIVNVEVIQYLILNDDKQAYVITFTANRGDFAKYRNTFEQIAQTFRFEK